MTDTNDTNETLLTFPCDFLLKAFGLDNPEFETIVLSAVRKFCPDLRENAFSYKKSKDGKYLAITIRLFVTSKEQLDSIYRELSTHPEVLMVL